MGVGGGSSTKKEVGSPVMGVGGGSSTKKEVGSPVMGVVVVEVAFKETSRYEIINYLKITIFYRLNCIKGID